MAALPVLHLILTFDLGSRHSDVKSSDDSGIRGMRLTHLLLRHLCIRRQWAELSSLSALVPDRRQHKCQRLQVFGVQRSQREASLPVQHIATSLQKNGTGSRCASWLNEEPCCQGNHTDRLVPQEKRDHRAPSGVLKVNQEEVGLTAWTAASHQGVTLSSHRVHQ